MLPAHTEVDRTRSTTDTFLPACFQFLLLVFNCPFNLAFGILRNLELCKKHNTVRVQSSCKSISSNQQPLVSAFLKLVVDMIAQCKPSALVPVKPLNNSTIELEQHSFPVPCTH